jgi:hypothetical protein
MLVIESPQWILIIGGGGLAVNILGLFIFSGGNVTES